MGAGLVLPPSPTRHRRPRGPQETVEAAPESSRRALQMSNLARPTGRSPKEVMSDRAKRVANKDFHPRPFGPKLLSSVGLGPIRPPVPRNCLKLPQSNISGVLAVMHFSDFSAKSVHSPRPPVAVSPARAAARDFFALRPLKTLVFNAFQCTSHHVYEPWDPSLTHLICHPHEHSSEERARNTQVLL